MVSKRGKVKPLHRGNVEKEKAKELDFDSFNKKYGGLTRTEYLKSIQ